MEKIGIVTVTYNSSKVIDEFITSVFYQTFKNYILYVVDNASSDNTLAIITEYKDSRLVIMPNKTNIGVAAGNNIGIKQALRDGCDGVLLINNDTSFENNLFYKLLEMFHNNDCSIVVPKMLYYSNKNIIWYGGGFLNKNKGYFSSVRGIDKKDNYKFNAVKYVNFAPSCCVLIEKKVFKDIGFMDEKYFVYHDETDYWYRVEKDGRHKMIYFGNVNFYHKVGSLTKSRVIVKNKIKFGNFYIKYTTRNQVYFLRKQKTLNSKLMIIYYYFRLNLKFFISGKYCRDISTFNLIQRSFAEGFNL